MALVAPAPEAQTQAAAPDPMAAPELLRRYVTFYKQSFGKAPRVHAQAATRRRKDETQEEPMAQILFNNALHASGDETNSDDDDDKTDPRAEVHKSVIRAGNVRDAEGNVLMLGREVERMLLKSEVVQPFRMFLPLRSARQGGMAKSETALLNDDVFAQQFREQARELYATRMLESMQVTPTPAAIARCRAAVPVPDEAIQTFFVAKGWVQDHVMVGPGPVVQPPRLGLYTSHVGEFGTGRAIDAALRDRALEKLLFPNEGTARPPAGPSAAQTHARRRAGALALPVLSDRYAQRRAAELRRVFAVSAEEIAEIQHVFVGSFPLRMVEDAGMRIEPAEREALLGELAGPALGGLALRLCLFVHATLYEPLAAALVRRPRTDDERAAACAALYTSMMVDYLTLEARLRPRALCVSLHLPLVHLLLHVAVETVMRLRYEAVQALAADLAERQAALLFAVFDPERLRCHIAFTQPRVAIGEGGGGGGGGVRVAKGAAAMHSFYQTSGVLRAAMPAPTHPRGRHMRALATRREGLAPASAQRVRLVDPHLALPPLSELQAAELVATIERLQAAAAVSAAARPDAAVSPACRHARRRALRVAAHTGQIAGLQAGRLPVPPRRPRPPASVGGSARAVSVAAVQVGRVTSAQPHAVHANVLGSLDELRVLRDTIDAESDVLVGQVADLERRVREAMVACEPDSGGEGEGVERGEG